MIKKLDRPNIDIPSELVQPLETLATFFDAGHPVEHRKDLKKWRYHIINDEQYNCHHGAGHLLTQYEETLQLIGAAYDLIYADKIMAAPLIATKGEIEQKIEAWSYFPTNLKKKEIINPIIAVRKFFREFNLNEYKDMLHEWLRIALSNKAATETLTAKEVITIYDNIRKIYSAAWIIHCRCNYSQSIIHFINR